MTLEELIAVKPTMRTFGMVAWTEMAVEMLLASGAD